MTRASDLMLGLFLRPEAPDVISSMSIDERVKAHALELLERGYTVVPKGVSSELCEETIAAFRAFERTNESIFAENRDANGHYPRIINLHRALPALLRLFTGNALWLGIQDVLFGAPTSLYTSLFYEVGSQQSLHRDTPVFATRPEYLYFGTTVYLEPAGDENGCLEVLEGGHHLPEVDRESMAIRHYGSLDRIPNLDNAMWVDYQETVVSQARSKGLTLKKVYVDAGDSLIWHPQLPHGGSAIRDLTRTRFSLVMHTTPAGVPVYHQNVFFNPNARFPEHAPWGYDNIDGRQVANFAREVGFGHQHSYEIGRFKAVSSD